jgi:hypothetical protein
MKSEEVEVTVAATLQSNLDGVNDGEAWTVEFDAIRFFDADGVATTDNSTGDLGDATGESFSIVEEGADDEIVVKTSSSDPDASTLQVEDSAKSDWYTVFVFDLDTDDSVNDIELNEVAVTVVVSSSTYATLVDDAELVIDGVTIDDVTADAGTSTVVLTFDVDGDVTIDAGDRVKAELKLRFKSLVAGNEGVTVTGSVTAANRAAIDAEGADDLATGQLSGAATGEAHTLRTSGIDVSAESVDADVTVGDSTTDDYGTYVIEVEVTAFEQDVYIPIAPVAGMYTLEDSTGSTSITGSRSVTLTSTADDDGTYFEITEGSTETLTLTVTYTPGVANTASRLVLNKIDFAPTAVAPTQSQTTLPASNYRTAVITMVN